jgi:hypothetical protein
MKTNRTGYAAATAVAATLGAILAVDRGSAAAPKFFPDDPIWVEHDTRNVTGIPDLEVDDFVDLTLNLFAKLGDPTPDVRAKNVNTVDEVPDSSWFTNRIGSRAVTAEEIAVGPDKTAGPPPGRWTVISSKTDGISPGFTIRDATGQVWFLKFDPPGYRAMATGTEVAVTKLMWALGYHVPENHVAALRRDDLTIGEGATFTPPGGTRRPMQPGDIDMLLKHADREPDGSYRIVASKALEGKPIGRIRFYDTRPDDPNDVVAHEHRRELRAYRVFAAWVNHVDVKSTNSRDMLVTENGKSFIRHNLIDFGSTLGSGGVEPREYWEGYEYLAEPGKTLKQMVAFGFYIPKWHYESVYEARSVGRIPADNTKFDPEGWKPRVPNQAFLRARGDDKFWAAQRLAAFNDDLLRAALRTGQFGDPKSEAELVRILSERRDAILRAYLPAVNPISSVALDEAGVLTFRNAAVDAGVAKAPQTYRARWSTFDNATGGTRPIGETSAASTRITAPSGLPSDSNAFVAVNVSASGGGANQSWEKPVRAYFRRDASGWRLVGFERMPEESENVKRKT